MLYSAILPWTAHKTACIFQVNSKGELNSSRTSVHVGSRLNSRVYIFLPYRTSRSTFSAVFFYLFHERNSYATANTLTTKSLKNRDTRPHRNVRIAIPDRKYTEIKKNHIKYTWRFYTHTHTHTHTHKLRMILKLNLFLKNMISFFIFYVI